MRFYRIGVALLVIALLASGVVGAQGLMCDQVVFIPDPDVYNERGKVCVEEGNYERAFADFNHAVELNPAYARAYNNRGMLYVTLGDTQAALDDFTRAIDLSRSYANPRLNRAWVHLTLGNVGRRGRTSAFTYG
jgi:tetratricopeptide (TPR) repeat protein